MPTGTLSDKITTFHPIHKTKSTFDIINMIIYLNFDGTKIFRNPFFGQQRKDI